MSFLALFLPCLPRMDQHDDRNGRGPSLLISDAAAALGVCRRTVYYRIRDGRLQTIRTRCGSQRVLISSIEALRADIRTGGSVSRAKPTAPLQPEPLPLQVQAFS